MELMHNQQTIHTHKLGSNS